MEKFVLFKVHEYMDMHPEDYVRTFIADDEDAIRTEAIKWANYMKHNYSGGTTTFVRLMGKDEAQRYIQRLIDREHRMPQDDSQEFIANIKSLFDKCYGG